MCECKFCEHFKINQKLKEGKTKVTRQKKTLATYLVVQATIEISMSLCSDVAELLTQVTICFVKAY